MTKPEKLPLYLIKMENNNLGLVDERGRLIHGVLRMDATHGPEGVVLTLEIASKGFDVGIPSAVSSPAAIEFGPTVDIPDLEKRYPFDVGGEDA